MSYWRRLQEMPEDAGAVFRATIGVFASILDGQGRILCVRQNYGKGYWTTPGGRLESGESLHDGLRREVLEETGFEVDVGDLVGLYHKPYRNDLVVCFCASIVGGSSSIPNQEIADLGYFSRDELPGLMAPNTYRRLVDSLDGLRGTVRIFGSE